MKLLDNIIKDNVSDNILYKWFQAVYIVITLVILLIFTLAVIVTIFILGCITLLLYIPVLPIDLLINKLRRNTENGNNN